MYNRFEGSFQSFDSTRIFYQGWKPEKTRAVVIITHGHGEHSESYHRLVEHFNGKGYEFWAWDLRGHGRSEGIRGYASSFQDFVQDYLLFLEKILPKVSGKSIFLLAHSMGALTQLSGLLERSQNEFKAQVISAPLLGLTVKVPAFKQKAAGFLEKYLPKLTLGNELTPDMLTREPEIMREFDKDPLRHAKMSPGVFLGILKQTEMVLSRAAEITMPTLFQCPEKDPVCNTEVTEKFSENIGSIDKQYLVYGNGARHEMYNDTHRAEVYKDLEHFLENHLKDKA